MVSPDTGEHASVCDGVLAARDLVSSYPGRDLVLRGAHVTLRAGRRTVLLGANGSVRFDRAGLREHRSRVQLVLQDPDDQLFSADVSQDVSFGPMNMGLPEREVRERVAESLELLGAIHLAQRATHHLSHGERKRVAIAGAVAMRPAVLLLDEPTAGLDPSGTAGLLTALTRCEERGTTVALSTHDVDLALAWGDDAALVVDGSVHSGLVEELLDDGHLLSQAHLARPWPLEIARRLGLADRPRDLDALVALLGGTR